MTDLNECKQSCTGNTNIIFKNFLKLHKSKTNMFHSFEIALYIMYKLHKHHKMHFRKIKQKPIRKLKIYFLSFPTTVYYASEIFFVIMYSRGQKKCGTRCYADTYHRREMKLVPFFIAKGPL